jgi:hypothetical protein
VLLTSRNPDRHGIATPHGVEVFTRAESVGLLRSALLTNDASVGSNRFGPYGLRGSPVVSRGGGNGTLAIQIYDASDPWGVGDRTIRSRVRSAGRS